MKKYQLIRSWIPALAGMILALLFSSWLMFHTFSYNGTAHEIKIAFKLWSDFGAHIPMIRSFSMGDNLTRFLHGTTQYPIFPGEPIRYHFLFFMFVGILEKIGLRIDWALNLPSIFGMTSLIVLLFILTRRLTGSMIAGILTVLFFVFNGSLGFMRFFDMHPISTQTISDIVTANDFPAFAPWGPGLVTAFWNLNIYTNQRHLALAMAIGLAFLLTCIYLERRSSTKVFIWIVIWSIILGLLPFFHQPLLLIIAVIMIVYFFIFPNLRAFLCATGILTLILVIPQLYAVRGSGSVLEWYPGYIFHNEYAKLPLLGFLQKMIVFWWHNIGLHLILIPIGYVLLPNKSKRWLLPLLPLFVVPNLVKFSIEASANHKFFNFALMIAQMCTAYTITWVFHRVNKLSGHWIIRAFAYWIIGIVLLVLTFSGIIDFFIVKNDIVGTNKDYQSNETASWIANNTPKDAVFLNSSYLYHPASLAGRPVFLGWPYFAWSAGYKENRMPIMDTMYETNDIAVRCALFEKYNISYVTVQNVKNDVNLPDIDLEKYLRENTPVFLSKNGHIAIFSKNELCRLK